MNYSHFRNTNEGLIDRFIRVSKGCLDHRMEAKQPSIETSLRNWELLSCLQRGILMVCQVHHYLTSFLSCHDVSRHTRYSRTKD